MNYAAIFENAKGDHKSIKVVIDDSQKAIFNPSFVNETDEFLIVQNGIETAYIPKRQIKHVSIFDQSLNR